MKIIYNGHYRDNTAAVAAATGKIIMGNVDPPKGGRMVYKYRWKAGPKVSP